MSKYLLYASFKWVNDVNEIEQKLMRIKSNSTTEYILEVDLEFPKKLHDMFNDYPLAPEKINLQKE